MIDLYTNQEVENPSSWPLNNQPGWCNSTSYRLAAFYFILNNFEASQEFKVP